MDENQLAGSLAKRRWRELQLRFGEAAGSIECCACEPVSPGITAIVVSRSLVELAGELIEEMMNAGLSVVCVGRSEGGPRFGYPNITVLFVKSHSLKLKMRRRFDALSIINVVY